ncbi:MAG: hypothetical protein ACYTFI_04020, partial [Planctomycetota bacterium]
ESESPFHLTVPALHDIGSKAAKEELKCAAQRMKSNIADKRTAEDRASRAKAKAAEVLMTCRQLRLRECASMAVPLTRRLFAERGRLP